MSENNVSNKPKSNNALVVWIGTAMLIVFGLALLASLVNLWPSIERGAATSNAGHTVSTVRLFFAAVTVKVTPSTALLLLVVITGALGSLIHATTSFADFVGNDRFYSRWSVWYLLRPIVGVSLAVLVYFAVRGGFLSDSSQSSDINPYGIAALAGLAGLFSKQATDKLREVFETLFHVSSKAGDAQRKDDLANGTPVIGAIDPSHVTAGTKNFQLTIHGEHFVDGATVGRVNGVAQYSRFISTQQVQVTLPDEVLAHPGTVQITAYTSPPGGGESHPLNLPIVDRAA